MGVHNRTYLSRGWTGVADKQIARRNGSCDPQFEAGSSRHLCEPE